MSDLIRLLVGLVLVSLLLLTGCEHDDLQQPDPPLEPTLSAVQTQIFNQGCALSGCHAGANPQMQLNLEAGQSHANLVGVASLQVPSINRVEPGEPDNSYLVMKVEGASGIVGERMPLGGAPLTAQQIQLIRDWIAAGALDN